MAESDPPTIARWLGKMPNELLYAVLAGAVGWAIYVTIQLDRFDARFTALEVQVDEIHDQVIGSDNVSQEGVRHAAR
jgi:hypothetical protein